MSFPPLAIVFHRRARNKTSLTALAAALETDPALADLPVFFLADKDHVPSRLAALCDAHSLVLFCSSFFSEQLDQARLLLARLRRDARANLFCLAGGPHPTGDPAGVLALGFDAVVRGEGERTFLDIVRALRAGRPLDGVAGVTFRRGEALVEVPAGPPVDLDAYPPVSFRFERFGPIEISRGCPFGCKFCQTSRLFGRRMRHRSPEVVADAARRYRARGMRDIRFVTPDAFAYGSPDGRRLDLSAVETLLGRVKNAIGAEGRLFFGSFPSEVRPEHVTEEAVALVLRYASNDTIVLGAQSGSQAVLDKCRRGHTVRHVHEAVDRIGRTGLTPCVDVLFGLPVESPDDARRSLDMILALSDKGAVLNVHFFMPLPGTPFAGMAPSPPPDDVIQTLHRLVSAGKAFGDWVRQRDISPGMAASAS